jgi:hypothetical protein
MIAAVLRLSSAPLLAVAGLTCAALLVVAACGGENAQFTGPTDDEVSEFRGLAGPWLEKLDAANFASLDRDYVYCLAIDEPVPLATTAPDASGHTRNRLPCIEAAATVVARTDEYRGLLEELEEMPTPGGDEVEAAHDRLVDIYRQRLDLYEEIAAALEAADEVKLAELRQRNVEVVEAELEGSAVVAALGAPEPE